MLGSLRHGAQGGPGFDELGAPCRRNDSFQLYANRLDELPIQQCSALLAAGHHKHRDVDQLYNQRRVAGRYDPLDDEKPVLAAHSAMSRLRVQNLYSQMVKASLFKPSEVDLSKLATLQLVNKRVGHDLKAQLTECR